MKKRENKRLCRAVLYRIRYLRGNRLVSVSVADSGLWLGAYCNAMFSAHLTHRNQSAF